MSGQSNWAGNHQYRYQRMESPRSVAEVRALVASASRVRALATRHSFNDICDAPELLLDITGLSAAPQVDAAQRIVTVRGGTTFGTVAEAVHAAGMALPNMGSLPHISVIGACATGTHGSGVRNRVLAASVTRIQLMVADGSIVDVHRGEADFAGVVVSLGALGIVLEVDLQLVATFNLVQTVGSDLSWSRVVREAPSHLASAYSVSIFTRWSDAEPTELLVKRRIDGDFTPPLEASVSRLLGAAPQWTVRDTPVPWLHALPHFRADHPPSFGNEIQSEFFVPVELTHEALLAVAALAKDMEPHLIVSEIRAVAADDLWLSPAHQRDTTAIHFTWLSHPREVADLVSRLQDVLAPFQARPHWGKVFDFARFDPSTYARIGDFVGLARRLDPAGKFHNDFIHSVLDAAG